MLAIAITLLVCLTTTAFPIFPLADEEFAVLTAIRRDCLPVNPPPSPLVDTWCFGSSVAGISSCPPTHPCTGIHLTPDNANASIVNITVNFPWWGVICNATTDPVSIVELHLPSQGLNCPLDALDMAALTNLQVLRLPYNHLSGPVPAWIGAMTSLKVLELIGNALTGSLPPSIIDNVELEELSLGENAITGDLPNSIKVLPLRVLDLHGNNLSGSIPPPLMRSSALVYLDLSENGFAGPLPSPIRLPSLVVFDVSFNRLNGSLPASLATWGRGESNAGSLLQVFDASFNDFVGNVPRDLDLLDRLATFSVQQNADVGGVIPPLPPTLLVHFSPEDAFGGANHSFTCPLPTLPSPASWGTFPCACPQALTTPTGACAACAPGFARINGTCSKCPAGSSSPGGDVEGCTACAEGTFANASGSSSCQLCPLGHTSSSASATSCSPCPPGTTSSPSGRCLSCERGFFSTDAGSTACNPCPAGTFASSFRSVACTPCPFASISNIGAVLCSPCGNSSTAFNATTCVARPRPGFGHDAFDAVAACPRGSFNNGSFAQCQPCPNGTASNLSEATACPECPLGTFSDHVGQTTCTLAPPGAWVGHVGAEIARMCPPGTYSAVAGAAACVRCPNGSIAPSMGAVACSGIPPGHVLQSAQWPHILVTIFHTVDERIVNEVAPQAFALARVQATKVHLVRAFDNRRESRDVLFGATQSMSYEMAVETAVSPLAIMEHLLDFLIYMDMLMVDKGAVLSTNATHLELLEPFAVDVAAPCAPGTYANGSVACIDCPAGTFSGREGTAACTKCPLKTRAAKPGAKKCRPCRANYFADATSTKCIECDLVSIDLSLLCAGAVVRLLCFVLPLLYAVWWYMASRHWLHGDPLAAPPLMDSFRNNGGHTVNTRPFPPPERILPSEIAM
ncbi:unnamed protein product [Aphanomyces euteiches]